MQPGSPGTRIREARGPRRWRTDAELRAIWEGIAPRVLRGETPVATSRAKRQRPVRHWPTKPRSRAHATANYAAITRKYVRGRIPHNRNAAPVIEGCRAPLAQRSQHQQWPMQRQQTRTPSQNYAAKPARITPSPSEENRRHPSTQKSKRALARPALDAARAAEFSICHHYSSMALRDALNTNRDLRIRARRHAAQPSYW